MTNKQKIANTFDYIFDQLGSFRKDKASSWKPQHDSSKFFFQICNEPWMSKSATWLKQK